MATVGVALTTYLRVMHMYAGVTDGTSQEAAVREKDYAGQHPCC